ncbi:MAG TPA: hypothetical protein VGD21_04280 [Lysobacter sp.]
MSHTGMAAVVAAMLGGCVPGTSSFAPAATADSGCREQQLDRLYFGLMTPRGELPVAIVATGWAGHARATTA